MALKNVTPWKPKPRLTPEAAFVEAAKILWKEESIRQVEELAAQLIKQDKQVAA